MTVLPTNMLAGFYKDYIVSSKAAEQFGFAVHLFLLSFTNLPSVFLCSERLSPL